MLEKTARIAEHATLTGCLSSGATYAARSYNAALDHLIEGGHVPATLFPKLAEDAALGEVGFASAQLAGYVEGSLPREPKGKKSLVIGDRNIVIGGLDEIADMVTERLPDWIRSSRREGEQSVTEPAPPSPTPPPPGSAPLARLTRPEEQTDLESLRPEEWRSDEPR
jgi:hypothetical protein